MSTTKHLTAQQQGRMEELQLQGTELEKLLQSDYD